MKPDWDKLGAEFGVSRGVVIADVDCTIHADLCGRFDVKGYPTIKYFTAETGKAGEAYNGGRDYESLAKFVDEKLASPPCTISDQSGCTAKEVDFIKKMEAKPEDIPAQLARLAKMKSDSMKPDLKQWLMQRINILEQLSKGKTDL